MHERVAAAKVFAYGTWGGEFHPDLAPQEGDEVAEEHWLSSGFANTDLGRRLPMGRIWNVV